MVPPPYLAVSKRREEGRYPINGVRVDGSGCSILNLCRSDPWSSANPGVLPCRFVSHDMHRFRSTRSAARRFRLQIYVLGSRPWDLQHMSQSSGLDVMCFCNPGRSLTQYHSSPPRAQGQLVDFTKDGTDLTSLLKVACRRTYSHRFQTRGESRKTQPSLRLPTTFISKNGAPLTHGNTI